MAEPSNMGIVVIGRNEGERLRACLGSLPAGVPAVYVDSGSQDGSQALAQQTGLRVIELDDSRPFTAARGRNTGWRALVHSHPDVQFVQFIDGDCTLVDSWLGRARAFMMQHPKVVAVCGRRRERYPQASLFNHLCDSEWNTPVGQAKAFGGDVLVRASALQASGGYDETLIAGEDPELGVRLRAAGGQIWRLDHEMTWHDADIHSLGQWWQRVKRAGYAYAEGVARHGSPPERHFVVETRRALLWGVALPIASTLLALLLSPLFWAGWLAYPAQVMRLIWRLPANGDELPWRHAIFLVLGRFPEAQGVLTYHWRRWREKPATLIEYK